MEQDDLLQRITEFRERHSMSATAFGKLAIGDGSLVHDMADRGRKPQGATIAKIAEFMLAHEEAQKEIDLSALWLIRRCGFVTLADGEPCLEGDTQISREIFQRLLADGRIVPNGDAMFGATSQTFRAKDQLNVAA